MFQYKFPRLSKPWLSKQVRRKVANQWPLTSGEWKTLFSSAFILVFISDPWRALRRFSLNFKITKIPFHLLKKSELAKVITTIRCHVRHMNSNLWTSYVSVWQQMFRQNRLRRLRQVSFVVDQMYLSKVLQCHLKVFNTE